MLRRKYKRTKNIVKTCCTPLYGREKLNLKKLRANCSQKNGKNDFETGCNKLKNV